MPDDSRSTPRSGARCTAPLIRTRDPARQGGPCAELSMILAGRPGTNTTPADPRGPSRVAPLEPHAGSEAPPRVPSPGRSVQESCASGRHCARRRIEVDPETPDRGARHDTDARDLLEHRRRGAHLRVRRRRRRPGRIRNLAPRAALAPRRRGRPLRPVGATDRGIVRRGLRSPKAASRPVRRRRTPVHLLRIPRPHDRDGPHRAAGVDRDPLPAGDLLPLVLARERHLRDPGHRGNPDGAVAQSGRPARPKRAVRRV